MNQRLKQMMLDAGYTNPEIEHQAFRLASMVVEECSNIALNLAFKYQQLSSAHFTGKKAGALEISQEIKDRFGVASIE